MPFKKKKPYGKRTFRRNTRKMARRGRQSIARPLKPAVYYFKRTVAVTFPINDAGQYPQWLAPVTLVGDNGAAGARVVNLSEISDHTDYTNLFKMYKIMAIRDQWYTTSTISTQGSTVGAQGQIQVLYQPNYTGIIPTDMTEEYFLKGQTYKMRNLVNGGRPVTIYTKCKQQTLKYGGSVTNPIDYSVATPKWISTTEDTCPHYGNDIRLQPVWSGGDITQLNIHVKIVSTYYIACKQVQ